jgi:osmotically-inducible protein OsmY
MEVDNEIEIDSSRNDRSDFEISLDIERGMRWSPYLNITKLKYTVNEGVVTFIGTVANRQSLDLARAIAIDTGARDIITTDVTIE